jgi:hypothetical protein
VKDAFRVWRDRRRIILEEAGTWASCEDPGCPFNV